MHAHDVGMVEARQRLRFLDEAVEAPLDSRRRIPASEARRRCPAARGEIGGEVFLDGDEAGERFLVGQIGDAEAARAQHPLDAVVADQLRPVRQSQQVSMVPAWLASPSSQAHGYQTGMSPNPRVMRPPYRAFVRAGNPAPAKQRPRRV